MDEEPDVNEVLLKHFTNNNPPASRTDVDLITPSSSSHDSDSWVNIDAEQSGHVQQCTEPSETNKVRRDHQYSPFVQPVPDDVKYVNIEADGPEVSRKYPCAIMLNQRRNTQSKVKNRMRKDAEVKKLATMENGSTTETEQTPKVKRKNFSRKNEGDYPAPNTTSETDTGPLTESSSSRKSSSSINTELPNSSNADCSGKREGNGLCFALGHKGRSRISALFFQLKKKKYTSPFCCAAITTFIMLVLIVTLYVSRTLSHINLNPEVTTVAVEGDYVGVFYTIDNHLLNVYDYKLQFEVITPNDKELISSASIFSIHCDSLLKRTNKTEKFTNSLVDYSAPMLLLNKIFFDSCSEYVGICILDQYIYQAKSRVSVLIYDITLDSYKHGAIHVRIVAYDDFDEFQHFLNGYGPTKAVKHIRVNKRSFRFVLSNEEMKRSAYYFFAIQNIKGSSDWFTVDRNGLLVHYNASNLSPECVMENSNSYSCEIKATSNQCLLWHVQENSGNHGNNSTSGQVYSLIGVITSTITIPGFFTVFGVGLALGIVIFVIACMCTVCIVRFSSSHRGYKAIPGPV